MTDRVYANARLIAAAPNLLEALKAYQDKNCLSDDADRALYAEAREAIAMAEGEGR